jgi:hypothetical protein
MLPVRPAGTSCPSSSRIRTSYPGIGLVAEPGFTGKLASPTGLPQIAQPVSVCHQWSITGMPSRCCAQCSVSGSQRSPARNSVRRRERSYFRMCSPLGSSRLMARKAVGAVKKAFTPCREQTRQNAPGSGVPTGLPS